MITDIAAEGNAVGKVDNMVVFVPLAAPGDVIDVRVTRKKKNYLEGKLVRFHSFSDDRVVPVCDHYGICGGCKLQHLSYEKQLYFKEKIVRDNLTRIGKVDIPEISPIIGSEDQYLYRNKLEYTFSSKRWLTEDEIKETGEIRQFNALGFHITGYFDKVLDIRQCHLQPEPTNVIRNAVREYAEKKKLEYFNYRDYSGFLRNLIVRTGSEGQVMIVVVFHHHYQNEIPELLNFIKSVFPDITSLMYVVNPKRNDSITDLDVIPYYGEDHLIENVDGLKFRIGPKSFFQANLKQSVLMYRIVREYASLKGGEIVYDLYTGTGTIANYIAPFARKVVGMEYVDEAVKDAEANSGLNNISNTSFYSGDLKDMLTPSFIDMAGRPDVVITDPPRSGMHPGVIKAIISLKPGRIVYVSCNPATQARDLNMLSEHYRVIKVQPVDMFPQTPHVENIILLDSI